MKSLRELLESLDSCAVSGIDDLQVATLAMRLDDVVPGALFACVPGSTRDGHDLAPEAVARGAVALLVDRPLPDVPITQAVVSDVRASLGPIGDSFYGEPTKDVAVYGITGTNGKTTTSHLLHSILRAAGESPGLIGTVGALVGGEHRDLGFTTPEAFGLQQLFAEMRDAGDRSCVMEVSSHALQQLRTRNVRFRAAAFTNLTRDHLDYHRGFEAYYLAKRKLFAEPGIDGRFWPAAINCDDQWGTRLFDELVHADRDEVPVWGYTVHGMSRASVAAKYRLHENGAQVWIESPVGDFDVDSKLRGRFNVENVLCAVTMALIAGVEADAIQEGIAGVSGVPGRFQPIDAGQPCQVYVDYAHTPDSLEKVLASARDICEGNLIVVFGCGGDRDKSKRPLMGRAAGSQADVAIITSDNPRSEDPEAIIRQIGQGTLGCAAEVVVEADRRVAIHAALERAEPGDVVVIAGKGHEQGQTFADEVLPFDDATVAREALGAAATLSK